MNKKGRVIQVRFQFSFENSIDDVAVKSHVQCYILQGEIKD